MRFATTDLCDDHANLLDDGRLAVLPPVFKHYGQRALCRPRGHAESA
jgi:regulator of ribonuclease activity A